METELLSVDDITKILRISRGTAQRWCRDRRLPAAKIGKAYRIRKEDLDKIGRASCRERVYTVV